MPHSVPTRRVFLFLQGIASPFFARLARALEGAGHDIRRVNLCGGDRAFWPKNLGAVTDYAEDASEWPAFLRREISAHHVTDIVLFGDRRPYHVVAVNLAEELGVTLWSYEEGYLRPDWITLEIGGNNGLSPLPQDPERILARAATLPDPSAALPASQGGQNRMVSRQLVYEAAKWGMRYRFPNWKTHRPYAPSAELRGWVNRLPRLIFRRRHANSATAEVAAGGFGHFFMCPLQIDSDFQLRAHSPFGGLEPAIRSILASFASKAPANTRLLIKNHPFDNGVRDVGLLVREIASELGIADRVVFMDGGHLPTLLSRCAGVVTVNSTVGLSALLRGRPVKNLGRAVYDVPGLTYGGSLDEFWTTPTRPDPELVKAFRRVLTADSQINGSFHTEIGMQMAVEGSLRRMGRGTARLRAQAFRSDFVVTSSGTSVPSMAFCRDEEAA